MSVNVSFRQVGCEHSGRIYRGLNTEAYLGAPQPLLANKDDFPLEKPSEESSGFGSSEPRFSLSMKGVTPGPGQYASVPSSQATSPSFSKKGYGGFASNTKRFHPKEFVSGVPGPGSYSTPRKRVDTHLSSIFIKPKALKSDDSNRQLLPGPGQYDPFLPKLPSRPSAIFKSKTTRPDNAYIVQGPPPWYYTPDETLIHSNSQKVTSAFKKPANGKLTKTNMYDPHAPVEDETVPGPGHYTQESYQRTDSLIGSYTLSELDRFGGTIHTRKAKESSPGPGHYEAKLPLVHKEKLPVSGSVFMSETQRDLVKSNHVPGPAFYEVSTSPRKKVFHLNLEQRWV